MSNRGRQNVASFLINDLGLDWRIGADYFESLLIDHDVYSNYGNWNALAGLTSGRINKFNIVKQSIKYDEQGLYIKHWLPELRMVPVPLVFQPWLMTQEQQNLFSVNIGETYPSPIITVEYSASIRKQRKS
jgi:deoxyribodipyrimidine photo-lyase